MSYSVRDLGLRTVDRLARFAGPFTTRAAGKRGQVPVLCYHRVLPDFAEGAVPAYSIRPEQFEAQLKHLSSQGYRALTLGEYEHFATESGKLPERAVLLTFDDGFADNFRVAAPIAKRYNMPLNVFVCTGLVEGVSQPINLSGDAEIVRHRTLHPELWAPLTWDQVRAMRDDGHGIGFHSHWHRDFSELDDSGMRQDIGLGLSTFENELGFRPSAFAFPQGTERSCPLEACALLNQEGMRFLFSTRLAVSQLPVEGQTLPRLMVYEQDNLETFALKLKGGYDWLGAARAMYQRRKMGEGSAAARGSIPVEFSSGTPRDTKSAGKPGTP